MSIDCEERPGERSAWVIARALEQLSPALRQLSDECTQRVRDLTPSVMNSANVNHAHLNDAA